jgi:hypothetical protein
MTERVLSEPWAVRTVEGSAVIGYDGFRTAGVIAARVSDNEQDRQSAPVIGLDHLEEGLGSHRCAVDRPIRES